MSEFWERLSPSQQSLLLAEVKDFTMARGLAVRISPAFLDPEKNPDGLFASPAPVTLLPSAFPRRCFEEAKAVQVDYNALYARATDENFLSEIVAEVGPADDFVAKLWNIHLVVKREGLGLFRSDYMIHHDSAKEQILQVEFNTIASSFGPLSSITADLHRHLDFQGFYSSLEKKRSRLDIPESPLVKRFAAGLVEAHELYGNPEAVVVIIIGDDELNVFDQRHIEYAVAEQNVRIFRLLFREVLQKTKLDSERRLIFQLHDQASYEVSVVYYRAGYDPSHYPDDNAWNARQQIELSRAIKCPTILTHLAGSKKVQEVLAQPSRLDKYKQLVPNEKLKPTFAQMYPLDDSPEGKVGQAIATDKTRAAHFVLKPQREGGGHNLYGEDIVTHLQGLDKSKWRGYILQEYIDTAPYTSSIFRNGQVNTGTVICELGIYGVCIWKNSTKEILRNKQAGWLLRTKAASSHEGGVAAGFGALDSLSLKD